MIFVVGGGVPVRLIILPTRFFVVAMNEGFPFWYQKYNPLHVILFVYMYSEMIL
jgi:hypothetical protein